MENSTRATLVEIYRRIYGHEAEIVMSNLDELARDLSEIVQRERPWTGKYLHSLIKEYPGFNANGRFGEALAALRSRLDGEDEVLARAKRVSVLALNGIPEHAIVLGKPRRCANPGCHVIFVPTHPRQKYHCRSCAKEASKLKRSG
jgi:hypothetical protein